MFILCVLISIIMCVTLVTSDSSRGVVYGSNDPLNITGSHFDLKLLKRLSDDYKFKLRHKLPNPRNYRKRNYLTKKHQICMNISDLKDCVHASCIANKGQNGPKFTEDYIVDKGKSTLNELANATAYSHNVSVVHSLEDLMRNQTNTLLENGKSRAITILEIFKPLQNMTTILTTLSPTFYQTEPAMSHNNNSDLNERTVFKYNEWRKGAIKSLQNKDPQTKQIQMYFRNEVGNCQNVSSEEISTRINIEKNSDNSVKEIMIIEIPIKSPTLRDKSIILDLNNIKESKLLAKSSGVKAQTVAFKGSVAETRNVSSLAKDIEQELEANIMKNLEQFKRDILMNFNKIINQKCETKENSTLPKSTWLNNKPKDNKDDLRRANARLRMGLASSRSLKHEYNKIRNDTSLENTPKQNLKNTFDVTSSKPKDTSANKMFNNNKERLHKFKMIIPENAVENLLTPSITRENISSPITNPHHDTQLITVYDNIKNSSADLKNIIAMYDIELKHPKQLLLVPKDFLTRLCAMMNCSGQEQISSNASNNRKHLTELNTKGLMSSGEKYSPKDKAKESDVKHILDNYALKSVFHMPKHCKNLTEFCTKRECHLCDSEVTITTAASKP